MLGLLLGFILGLPAEQDASAQKLFESGNYDAVIQKAEQERQGRFNSPETTFFVTQAYMRKEQPDRAREEFGRLKTTSGDEAWKAIGDAGEALAGGDAGGALGHAKRATQADGGNPYAQYLLGLAAVRQNDFAAASAAFARAVELKNDLAYAHYFAAQAFQRQRNLARAADHYEAFLKLAPGAPERAAVQGIMKTLRG
jgi:tetratricopeptide (TPR) repeat protein